MQISHVSESFKRGARLRYPLRDARGILLLAQGAEITDKLYSLLHLRGILVEVQGFLRVTSGELAGQEIPIRQGQMTIGRHPDCDVQIASQVVSGFHCRIYRLPLDVLIEDLESRNGTYRNDQPIVMGKVQLHDGDRIRVGSTQFTIELFAAMSANTSEGSQALHAWILADSESQGFSPMGATAPDICLDIPPEFDR
jgi:predicted component of type VI protein secretion system